LIENISDHKTVGIFELNVEASNLELDEMTPGIYMEDDSQVELLPDQSRGKISKVLVKSSLEPKEKVSICFDELTKIQTVKKYTQAELSIKTGGEWRDRKYIGGEFVNVQSLKVPAQHTDHSYFIRYEGPGLENEIIGYRYYMDWRNALDIFGKKVDTLVLQSVGQDGFDSYHEMAPWGMDVLKAGKSLGIGSIGQFINGVVSHFEVTDSVKSRVKHNGHLMSSIETSYYGWTTENGKSDIVSTMSIYAGDRALKHEIESDSTVKTLCTGIVKHEKGRKIESLVGSAGWAYIATFGEQSLANDNLGLAIIYNAKDVQKIQDSEYDHLLIFKPFKKVTYYLLGAWEQEPKGIKTLEEFTEYLDAKVSQLNGAVLVSML
jgi:hypothetical protein